MAGAGKALVGLVYLLSVLSTFYLFKKQFEANFGKNECGMTFMWRQIALMDVGFEQYNHYSLFLYGEGHYARNYQNTQHLDGIPIIFVPGNAGSGRQVRSIASVLQNKTENRNTNFHFDVFAVDFNEEFSGIHSTYLLEHIRFVKNAINHVWSLYKTPPPGIILYGHSLGGVVSRLVLEDKKIRDKIAMVFTLASPFGEPPFPIDNQMLRFWKRMHSRQNKVPIISVDGGLRDELIDPEWTRSPFVLHASATEIDEVWLETDHQCIVWCNQLVRQNTRFLFDYARSPSKFVHNYVNLFNKHFKTSRQYVEPTKVDSSGPSVSPNDCSPKCPTSGILKLDSTLIEKAFVSIVDRFDSHLSKDGKVVGKVQACGYEKFCSFYSGVGNGVSVDLKGKDVWILDKKPVETIELPQPFSSNQVHKFNLVGMTIVHLNFPNPLFAYRIQIKSTSLSGSHQQIQRAIFVTDQSKKLAKLIPDDKQSIIVNLANADDSNARFYFFSQEDAQVEIEIVGVDPWITITKILRAVRVFIIPSLIGLHLLCVLFGLLGRLSILLLAIGIVPLATLWQPNSILFGTTLLFVSLVYLFIVSANVLIASVFRFLNRRGVTTGLAFQFIIFVAMLAGASQTHTFPFVLMSSIWLICSFPRSNNLLIWTELFLFTQFPSAFEFFFGLAKYRQFTYVWSSFGLPALIFITNCGAFLAFKSKNSRPLLALIYLSIEIPLIVWFLREKATDSLLALDSLSLLCTLFTTFELALIHWNNSKAIKKELNNSNHS